MPPPQVLTDVSAPETPLLKSCASDKRLLCATGAAALWQGTLLVAATLCHVIGASFLPDSALLKPTEVTTGSCNGEITALSLL